MPYSGQTSDITLNNLNFKGSVDSFRVIAATLYQPGMAVQYAPIDKQVYPDQKAVQPVGTAANQQLIVGLVSVAWPGFTGSIGAASFTSPSSAATVRGTVGVDVQLDGFHPAALVDQSGTGAATISNGAGLIASRATVGYMQGGTVAAGMGTAAIAMLPSAGFGSSITAAALAQASQTATIAGTPAAGDTLSITIQTPYSLAAPGVAQTTTFTTPPLTAGQAASVTTAAAALVAYLNAQVAFSTFYVATNAAGVVTVAVNTLANDFLVTFGSGSNVTSSIVLSLSGVLGNSITFACAATGGSTNTAGAANLASGTGYKGKIPCVVV